MNTIRPRIWITLGMVGLFILSTTGCQGFLAAKATPTPLISSYNPARGMSTVKCPFTPPPGMEVTCGKVEAPEDYAQLEGDKIELFTVIIHTPETAENRDAVVLLPQSAGFSLTDNISYIGRSLGDLLEERDLVYYEYRGLGQSEVDLNCREYYDAYFQSWMEAFSPEEEVALYTPALETCKERMFNAQVDPDLYTVDEMAADLHMLRLVLGYSQFDLLAGGFGSVLALTMIRDYPQSVRSVALFDVDFPKAYLTAEIQAISLQHSLDLLFNKCSADEDCRLAYPDLEQKLYAAVDQLNAHPAEVKLFFPGLNNLTAVKVSGNDFLMLLNNMLFSNTTIDEIPRLVHHVTSGNIMKMSVELQQYGMNIPEELVFGPELNSICDGLHANFWQVTPASRDVRPVVLEAVLSRWRVFEQLCTVWSGDKLAIPAGQPLSSEVPLIVFHGEFMPDYTPEIVDSLLVGMENAKHIVVPNVSNDAFGGESCAGLLLFEWLEEADINMDTSCMNNTEEIPFRMPDQ